MDNKINNYVQSVMNNIIAEEGMKKRIESDLYSHLNSACENEAVEVVLSKMGAPESVAKDFMENIYESKNDVIEKLVQERTMMKQILSGCYEYKSNIKVFGLPLIHIKTRRYGYKPCVAKGIIAIGDVSIGVLSLGGLALGGFTFGGISIGALSFGGIALAALVALGGFAAGGLLAVGGMAVSLGGAIGGLAMGKIALGGYAKGIVAIGDKAIGRYTLEIKGNMTLKEDIIHLIKSAYPRLSYWIVRLFTFFGA